MTKLASRHLTALRSKVISLHFKHRISEVFTSSDVSLHNIVIFLSYKPFETCQILLWITKGDSFQCYVLGCEFLGIFHTEATIDQRPVKVPTKGLQFSNKPVSEPETSLQSEVTISWQTWQCQCYGSTDTVRWGNMVGQGIDGWLNGGWDKTGMDFTEHG